MSIIHMLFSAKGRIRRRDFWLWSIVLLVVYFLLVLLSNWVFSQGTTFYAVTTMGFAAPGGFIVVDLGLMVLFQWVNFCIVAKRAHDRQRPAIVAGTASILSLLYAFLGSYFPSLDGLNTSLKFIIMIAGLWILIDCGCLDGTKGPNKYGPSPKQIPAPADVF
jgi:uncharacterized membrane protein YhaH (DUF805 family)